MWRPAEGLCRAAPPHCLPKSPGQAFKRELYQRQVEAERLWQQSSCREAAQEAAPLAFGASRDRWTQLEEELLTRQVGALGPGWEGGEGP